MKRRTIARAASLMPLFALFLAAPCHAQEPQFGGAPASAEDRDTLQRFSRCVAARRESQARNLLAGDFMSDRVETAFRQLALSQRSCLMSGRLSFSGVLFAGGMAEELLGEDAPRGSLAERVALDPARPALQARDDMELMSLCVVRAAPADVEALLATEVGSVQENAAIAAVAPKIGDCLTAGVNARVNRPGLRAMLALAAYRLVQHNAAAPAVVGN